MPSKIFSLVMIMLLLSSNSFSWPIPDTGQITCFDNYSQIECPEPGSDFYGQDGHYIINAPSYTKLDTTGSPLPDNAASWAMIQDNMTGLIWEFKTEDQSIHDQYKTYEWNDAQQTVIDTMNDLGYGGFSHWRLPEILELISIINLNYYNPVMDPIFNGTASFYWSSVPTSNTDGIWGVNFFSGIVNYSPEIILKSVRAVYHEINDIPDNWIVNAHTIINKRTGLMWQRETFPSALNWKAALAHCESLTLDNYSDWRLPNIKELLSIVKFSENNPSIFPEFDTMTAFYWSSTTHTKNVKNALGVDFDFGTTGNQEKVLLHYVRAVRGGQPQLSNHIYIQSPKQGDIWNEGNIIPIIWEPNNISGDVQILVSGNGGQSFTPIVHKTSNDGHYDWSAPFPLSPSANCFLKIVPINFPDKGNSLGLFTIEGQSILIKGQLTDVNDMPIKNTSFSINGTYLQTNQDGYYEGTLTVFQAGTYDLLYWINNYQANIFENISLQSDKTNVLNFQIPTIFSLNGYISDYFGSVISGVTVTVQDQTEQTDTNGFFQFDKLESGTTTIHISHPDYYALTTTTEIIPGKCISLNPELMQKGLALNFVTAALPESIVGETYQFRIKANGSMPLIYSLISGSFPKGLTLNSEAGMIYGSACNSGTYTFTLGIHDANNMYAEREFTIDSFDKLTLTTQQISGITANETYGLNIIAKGGLQPYIFEIIEGSLPQGMTLFTSGKLSGTPLSSGKTTITVQVTDSRGEKVNTVYDIQVYEPMQLPSEILINGIVGAPLTKELSVTGGDGNYVWYVDSDEIPKGLTIDNTTQTLTGTFNQAVKKTIVLFVTDSEGRKASCMLSFHIVSVLTLITTELPDALKNEPYSEKISVQGGIGPYTYTFSGLPPNLTYNSQSGIISGTSILVSYNNIEIQVSDSTKPDCQTLMKTMGLRTKSGLTILSNAVLPKVMHGQSFQAITLIAGGGQRPYSWYCKSLPESIYLDPIKGTLSGIPSTEGYKKLKIGVQDAGNQIFEKEFVWQSIQKLEIKTHHLDIAYENIVYNNTIDVIGGIPPYHFQLQSGTLPSGLFLHENGLIYGRTTAESMPQQFTIEVIDHDNPPQTIQKIYQIETKNSLSLAQSTIPEAIVGQAYHARITAMLGNPPYNWTIGSIPNGLTYTVNLNTVTIEGAAQNPGLLTWVVEVSDSSNPVEAAIHTYTIAIYDQMTINNDFLKTAQTHVYYSDTIQVVGGKPPYTCSINNDVLPEGLFLNSQTGEIYGTINDPVISAVRFNVDIQDSMCPPTIINPIIKFEVDNELGIITRSIPDTTQFHFFSTTLVGGGGFLPYQWQIIEGDLPHCVYFDESTGIIQGHPNTAGTFTLKFELIDKWNNTDHVTYDWTVTASQIAGDINNDGILDLIDLIRSLQYISSMENHMTYSFDINNNCSLELAEVLYLISNKLFNAKSK